LDAKWPEPLTVLRPMTSRNDIFETACIEEFAFLTSFGFVLIESVKDNFGCRLTYNNSTSAIKIKLDRAIITVDYYILKDGEIPKHPIFFNSDEEFLVFDLNDLLILKTDKKIDQDYKLMYQEEYMKKKIKEFAVMLQRYGADFLSGDFSLLPQIKDKVVRRAKELEHEQ
jgi:hypothetical protein